MIDKKLLKRKSGLRRNIQIATAGIVLITIVGGFKYPLIGFVVPIVMLIGIVGGFLNGRFVCGWLCPRGGFYDRVVSKVSPKRKVPSWLRDYKFRWFVFAALMGFMVFQILLDPGNIYHWGKVFVRICFITTALGVLLAFLYHPRTWCSFCPMGTLQSVSDPKKHVLTMVEGCLSCKTCEKACPMDLKIVDNIKNGRLDSKDCLKCPECQLVCPKEILHLRKN